MIMGKLICLNCEASLTTEKYCPDCGQKVSKQDLSFKFLVRTFVAAFTSFDLKLFRSFRDVWIPNKIGHSFLKGKKLVYVNHIRFLFICLVVFFGLISLNIRSLGLDKLDKEVVEQAVLKKMKTNLDSLKLQLPSASQDSLLDSLTTRLFQDEIEGSQDFFHFNDIKMTQQDVYYMHPDSLMNKYSIEGKLNRLILPHLIKSYRSAGSAVKYVIGNMLWGFPMVIILLALFLKLLYIRHQTYYVEHVVHLVNFHCILLILSSILLVIELFRTGEVRGEWYSAIFVIAGLHLTYSLKRFYNDSWWKSLIKGFLIMVAYVMLISFVILFMIVVSIMVF